MATPVRAATGSRLLHAGLTVRDRAAMDRFYVDVLGFSEIWRGGRTDDVTDWINMKVPDGTEYIEYMLVGGPVTRSGSGRSTTWRYSSPDMQTALRGRARACPAARSRTSARRASAATAAGSSTCSTPTAPEPS